MTSQLQSMFQNLGGQKQKARKLKIKDAMKLLIEEEAGQLPTGRAEARRYRRC